MATTQTNTEISLAVTGMTCGSGKRHVEDALTGVPGVATAQVDVAGGRATVSYDPAAATPEGLIEAIVAAGYGAEVSGADACDTSPAAKSCGCCATRIS